MAITFNEIDVRSGLKKKRNLSTYINRLIRQHLEVKKVDIDFIFCRDEYLLGLNQQFLNHDTFTDIITFDLSEGTELLKGEIYISIERVAENASKFETDYNEELHRVIFHGILHLCGFKDKKKEDQQIMRMMENQSLEEYKTLLRDWNNNN